MRLVSFLTSLTKSELEELKDELNLTDDEVLVFDQISHGRSIVATADRCNIATSTVSNRIKSISKKVSKVSYPSLK